MSKILSIGTALPAHRHRQEDILLFMQRAFALDPVEQRKLKFLYHQGGIATRYSAIADYSHPMADWKFYPPAEHLEPFPTLEQRMQWYQRHAPQLSVDAIRACAGNRLPVRDITHLITVSCTGMSAPGLDLQVMELLDLPRNIFRTSLNFMGCYAAIHALKLADVICRSDPAARVMLVCTELCTLHFQKEPTPDNLASTLLFSDGSAAALVVPDAVPGSGLVLEQFYSEVVPGGKRDMAWELSSTGFQMTLSGYIPDLIEADFAPLVERALRQAGADQADIRAWCLHPGGKRILDTIRRSLQLEEQDLAPSYQVLQQYGNMSSPTILFVLQEWMRRLHHHPGQPLLFGAAFGPGLTMETFLARHA
ncbi:MAG TPA: type III polyketide synthase [Lacibacter sp.]|nr:type III polyketide synthase [Lacibacter sp.]HMO87875.1 type III polyketide synthase [Lacibacter sp.]